jgi:integrase
MSVTIRSYRRGGWEVDITTRLPNGSRHRERCKAPGTSKSAAQRWGEDRERHLLRHGLVQPKKEVPTLEEFAPRFLDGYARANRQKPSGIAAKETILNVHLIPLLGSKTLDAITNETVQRLKHQLRDRAPKTVNNVLTVLNVMLKKAVEWDVIDRMPCTIRVLPIPKASMGFYDFDEYERLVAAAKGADRNAYLIVLLGGEAGLRCGEIIALEWRDVDIAKRQLCVQRSEWRGHVTVPKGGRLRYVPMTVRLATALRVHRHLRSSRVICQRSGEPLTQDIVGDHVRRAARRAQLTATGAHRLRHTFCSHLAMRGAPARAIQELAGHQDLTTTQRYMHLSPAALDSAIRLLDSPGILPGRGDISNDVGGVKTHPLRAGRRSRLS